MMSSLYVGQTGLLAFSKGLDTLSNNIANLNTPGFKANELAFRDLVYRQAGNSGDFAERRTQFGFGVDTPFSNVRYRQGELRDTGNAFDAAIDGQGFFILRRDGDMLYTRAGQFELNSDGELIDQTSKAQVMGLQADGTLGVIDLDALRSSAPKATARITFIGNLSSGAATHQVRDITVYDAAGAQHQLSVRFTRDTTVTDATVWRVEVRDQADTNPTTVRSSGTIRFQPNGSPADGANTMSFDYEPGNGLATQAITLDFGQPGTFSGTTSFASGSTSDAKVSSQDGYAFGALTKTAFNEKGEIRLTYSNGQTTTGPRLALAFFADPNVLQLSGGAMFIDRSETGPIIQGAQEGVMGKIAGGKIELSNVELTEQFTDMVIIQRGYQASSQAISVANEMMQQLMDMDKRR